MDQNLENEQPNITEIKNLNERFHPFDPDEGPVEQLKKNGLAKEIKLQGVPRFPFIPIGIRTFFSLADKKDAITPFYPPAGYQVTTEDFNLQTRAKKRNDPQWQGQVDESEASLHFRGRTVVTQLEEIGISQRRGFAAYMIKPEVLPTILRLRMQVTIPGSPAGVDFDDPSYRPTTNFESAPDSFFLQHGDIIFQYFYPLETGPLATNDPEGKLTKAEGRIAEGLFLQLPNNPSELKKIEVKFILLPEEKPEVPDQFHRAFENEDVNRLNPGENKSTKKGAPRAFWNALSDDKKDWDI